MTLLLKSSGIAAKSRPRNSLEHEENYGNANLLADLLDWLEKTSPVKISFEDLSGIRYDIPELRLPEHFCIHAGKFCQLAKSNKQGHADCIKNKRVTNWKATSRATGFSGICHLGITDAVEPLLFHGQVLGVFYLGSVVLSGTETEGVKRITKYCTRRGIRAKPLLDAYASVPRIEQSDYEEYIRRLRVILNVCTTLLDAYSLPLTRYLPQKDTSVLATRRRLTPLIDRAERLIHQRLSEKITVSNIAKELKCHPDHLSRQFKKVQGIALIDFIHRVRIDHARRLIATTRLSLGEISWELGYQEQSHFSRVFKSLVGVTPGQYRKRHN